MHYVAIHRTLQDMTVMGSVSCLLPNLVELEMNCSYALTNALFFTSRQLRRLSLSGISGAVAISQILKHVLSRSPDLAFLHLQCNPSYTYSSSESGIFEHIEDHFTDILKKLHLLQELILVDLGLTQKMLLVLGTLPKLKILR